MMLETGEIREKADRALREMFTLCAAEAADDTAFRDFCGALYRNAASRDIAGYSPRRLLTLAQTCFACVRNAQNGESLVEIVEAGGEDTVLVAVNDDSPFLFDSVIGETTDQSVRLRAAFHPIIDRDGRRRSVIVLVLERIADAKRCEALKRGVETVLAEVHAAVADWQAMRTRLAEAVGWLRQGSPHIDVEELDESIAFLEWLGDNHFTFLGCRDYAFSDEGVGRLEPLGDSGLGVLSDAGRRVVRRDRLPTTLSDQLREFLTRPSPLIVAKSNEKSLVHRRVYMDYFGVKFFDAKGALKGERRFVGLFTSGFYSRRPGDIPLLRLKAKKVMERAGFLPTSHDAKTLAHIIDSYPRDELFQIDEDELFEAAIGILQLGERPEVRMFARRDRFDRFVSAIVFLPRDRYNAEAREKVHAILARAYRGEATSALPMLGETALARVTYTVGRGEVPLADPDVAAIEADIRHAIRTWDDALEDALCARFGAEAGERTFRRQAPGFPVRYRDAFAPHEAVEDLVRLETLAAQDEPHAAVWTWRREGDAPSVLRLKLYGLGTAPSLSQTLPVFEHFGLRAIDENAYPLSLRGAGEARDAFVLDFLTERADQAAARLDENKRPLEEALHAVLSGQAESDGFNRLVMRAGLAWREVAILRTAAKYLRQTGIPFGQDYMEDALARNPGVAKLLVDLFHARLGPAAPGDAAACDAGIETALAEVQSLDDDRIIRRFRNLIRCVLRTNYYQPDKASIAVKLDSSALDDLPAPRPLVEIFVYAPEVEGVHLRFGKVARGGLRWSDRREDFRTEVLGLVKAQQVKNTVIVPVGAKGGFYPKRLPTGGREAVQAAGISAYRTFIEALLDVTDNLDADGAVVPPPCVVRHDADDPYLVVAADKGTATFSDIANDIAKTRGFWLGDAFASGGSHGYDHKKMGITAKGAWEAVKRHFREMGKDCQKEPFSCIGVGDMSGDVFGNGMLLSRVTKLVAAFDHRHIFLDPDPDPEAAWRERKRLFDLPRSSWADYDAKLISQGGGVFPRTAKTVALSDAVKALTGIESSHAAPNDIIRALLKAEVDLLFFGGIGTYVKASSQSQFDAGDRANDALRIDGCEVRAKVIGEGANLGLTQLGRIEAANAGVRLNTDAIDNSAGVDTSDHEVNLKILVGGPTARGEIDAAARDTLLQAMTDDVAALVLKDNYDQTLALSAAEAHSAADLDAYGRFMLDLENRGSLDRAVEFLPDGAELRRRAAKGTGLTRPELAVLLAYAKLDLKAALATSDLPADPLLTPLLAGYFPAIAAERFEGELARHRLRREIIVGAIANRIVNIGGPLFVFRLCEVTGVAAERVARAFFAADGAFSLSGLAARICSLDGRMDAQTQVDAIGAVGETLRHLTRWFAVNAPETVSLSETVLHYRAGADALRGTFATLVSPFEAAATEARIEKLTAAGATPDIADEAGALPLLAAAPDIICLARQESLDLDAVAAAYFAAGQKAGIDHLRAMTADIASTDHWDRLAIRRIGDDLYAGQRRLAAAALAGFVGKGRAAGRDAAESWAAKCETTLTRIASFIDALDHSGPLTVAKLTLANSQIRELAGS